MALSTLANRFIPYFVRLKRLLVLFSVRAFTAVCLEDTVDGYPVNLVLSD